MIKPTVIIGSQWGDEGKGKLTDAIARDFDVVGRFNGGNNAGHTLIHKGNQVKLHVLPSGIFHKKQLLIAQGAVFDPEILVSELQYCQKNRLSVKLMIDYRVNLVMPYHKLMDMASEKRKGKGATGSVRVGIGFCYEDRNNRSGIRVEDLFYPQILKQKIEIIFALKKDILEKVYGVRTTLTSHKIFTRLMYLARYIKPYAGDVTGYVHDNLPTKKMLFEGAMATMLDASFGTYPYTVANHTIATSLFTSLGIPQMQLNNIGVIKAYTTRVGSGPFPTEQKNNIGEILQKTGHEIAVTSGRIRRCGFLDLCIIRYAHKLNGFSSLAITKLDVLDSFDKIPVCVGYKLNGKKIREYPAISHQFYKCQPIYKNLTGWRESLQGVKKYGHLPKNAREYLKFIETEIDVPIKYISTGAERDALIKKV